MDIGYSTKPASEGRPTAAGFWCSDVWRYLPSAIGPAENGGSGCCQAPNMSLVPVYDRITFFGTSALRIS